MRRLTHGTERRGQGALRATALLTLLIALLVAPATAGAAIDGKLKQLALPNGCLDDAAAQGCGNITAPMTNVGEPAFTPNGRFMYVPGRDSDSVNVFERNASTGVLTERGCVSLNVATGCVAVGVSPLEDATGVVVSHDGKNLYVVGGQAGGAAADGIATFTIQASGIPSFEQCFNSDATTGCAAAPAFANPATVAEAPDGKSVYVANNGSGDGITIFKRSTTTGLLNQAGLTAAQKCMKRVADADNCTVNGLLESPRDIEVTPDNKQVLVANVGCFVACYKLIALDRPSPDTSVLTQHPGAGGCISYYNQGGPCTQRNLFYGPNQIAITSDGRQIYVAMRGCCNVTGLMLVGRNPTTGNLSPNDFCAKYPGTGAPCTTEAKALSDPHDVALSPDNKYVYTAGFDGQRLGVFDRASDNTVAEKPGAFGCLAASNQGDACGGVTNGGTNTNIEYVLPSPDGRQVYSFGSGGGVGKIFSFAVDHAPRCSSPTINTAFNTGVTITLPCTDQDGDPLSFQILSQPAKGQLGALQGNKVTYGPLLGTSGPDSFTFRATGAGVPADTATVHVNVASAPAGPAPAPAPGPGPGPITPPPLTVLASTISNHFLSFPKFTKIDKLAINDLVAGERIQVKCKTKKKKQQKKGCPYKSRTVTTTFRRAKLNLLKPFRTRRLPPGTKVTIIMTAPNFIGKQFTYTVRKGKSPKSPLRLCIPPGGRPARCA